MGQRDQAELVVARVGERAAPVAEQLALDQGVGQRAAVDRDERTIAPRPTVMDRARDEFLAGARFAFDQYRRVVLRRLCDEWEEGEKCLGLTNHDHEPCCDRDVFAAARSRSQGSVF